MGFRNQAISSLSQNVNGAFKNTRHPQLPLYSAKRTGGTCVPGTDPPGAAEASSHSPAQSCAHSPLRLLFWAHGGLAECTAALTLLGEL